jgi:hypothetical protein
MAAVFVRPVDPRLMETGMTRDGGAGEGNVTASAGGKPLWSSLCSTSPTATASVAASIATMILSALMRQS